MSLRNAFRLPPCALLLQHLTGARSVQVSWGVKQPYISVICPGSYTVRGERDGHIAPICQFNSLFRCAASIFDMFHGGCFGAHWRRSVSFCCQIGYLGPCLGPLRSLRVLSHFSTKSPHIGSESCGDR